MSLSARSSPEPLHRQGALSIDDVAPRPNANCLSCGVPYYADGQASLMCAGCYKRTRVAVAQELYREEKRLGLD